MWLCENDSLLLQPLYKDIWHLYVLIYELLQTVVMLCMFNLLVLEALRIEVGLLLTHAGQQQLMCLARILLKRPCVVCLDECTANVDPNTALVMQDLIAAQLEQSTVIQVGQVESV